MTRRATVRTSETQVPGFLRWHVPGTPRPKGSMTVVDDRKGHLVDSEASRRWRGLMAATMVRGVAVTRVRPGGRIEVVEMRPGFPIQCPVIVAADYQFTRPDSVDQYDAMPVGAAEPDIDKLLRNTLDALVDARVIADDGLVVGTMGTKRYVGKWEPGMTCWLAPAPSLHGSLCAAQDATYEFLTAGVRFVQNARNSVNRAVTTREGA